MASIKNIFKKLKSYFSPKKSDNKNIVLKPGKNTRHSSLTKLVNQHEFVLQDAIHATGNPKERQKKDYLRFLMRLH